jgi:hypothetical protein
MKNGKIRHYQSRRHYLNSMQGMFANQYQKKNHTKKLMKNRKRKIKHRGGVGKVSSVKKKTCEKCKREKPLNKGVCRECEEAFASYKQPEKAKIPKYKRIGNKISENWKNLIEDEENWNQIKSELNYFRLMGKQPPYYVFIIIDQHYDQDIQIEVESDVDEWSGLAEGYWYDVIVVTDPTRVTKQDFLNRDVAEHSGYWKSLWVYEEGEDLPEWDDETDREIWRAR